MQLVKQWDSKENLSTDGANEETTVNTSPTHKIRSGSKHGMVLSQMGPLAFDMNKQGNVNQPTSVTTISLLEYFVPGVQKTI